MSLTILFRLEYGDYIWRTKGQSQKAMPCQVTHAELYGPCHAPWNVTRLAGYEEGHLFSFSHCWANLFRSNSSPIGIPHPAKRTSCRQSSFGDAVFVLSTFMTICSRFDGTAYDRPRRTGGLRQLRRSYSRSIQAFPCSVPRQ
jgi:hypothetical protein